MPEEPPKELWGRHDHKLDERGRLTVPAPLRPQLGTDCVALCGPDQQIRVYPRGTWETMKAGLLSQDFADRMDDEMDALQTFLGNCDFTAVDPQARLPLQGYLREWAGVEEGQQVVVIGKGDRLEVWNKERFREASLKITATRLKEISARRKTEGGVVPATVASEAQEA